MSSKLTHCILKGILDGLVVVGVPETWVSLHSFHQSLRGFGDPLQGIQGINHADVARNEVSRSKLHSFESVLQRIFALAKSQLCRGAVAVDGVKAVRRL
eukprot:CAMPEP_0117682982 /NCGR_PEP_ID=MMETSP0804-20121206/20057_1 /TAXON_ID=1074897 /ORGANISM="Tetraselmis astigmatica, Strain CCMP880" /LENGTH=98 /DNA_ID=CAMNT_0005493345 /DNA_START=418 /DNA_END=715 /DNA_ORIENTATION=-